MTLTFTGLLIGLATFLIIGLFHPIVIKTEYYYGTRPWWIFLLAGLAGIGGSLFITHTLVASIAGVAGFSALWSILELFEQQERVDKGWFPAGPGHRTRS